MLLKEKDDLTYFIVWIILYYFEKLIIASKASSAFL